MAGALIVLPLVYFYPAVIGWISLAPGDGITANLGLRILVGQMIAHGQLPLWNPHIFAGMPLLATGYPGVLYPPNWLFAVLPPGAAMNAVVITTYHLALIGAYLYARRIGIGRLGALVSATAFAFSGYLVAHLGQTSHIAAAAWLPWILLAVEHLHARQSWRWISLGAAFIALQCFAGVPQMTLYTAMVCGAYVLFLATARAEPGSRLPFLVATAAMAVCGALLCFIQLLPLRELQPLSSRRGIVYEVFASFSLPPQQALGLIFPWFFGGALLPPYHIKYWGAPGTAEMFGYAGLLTLLLAIAAVLKPSRSRLVWFWAGAAVAALLLAFGAYLPFGIHKLLYHVPVYNLFRVSSRNLLIVNFALAVLAGLGLNRLVELDQRERWRLFRHSVAVLAAMVALAAIGYRYAWRYLKVEAPPPAGASSLQNPEAVIPFAFFILSVAALWFYQHRLSALAGGLLLVILLLDLASFGHFYEWRAFRPRISEEVRDPPAVTFIKARERDTASFRIVSHALWPLGENYSQLNHPDLSIARGLQSVNGYDMLQLSRLAELAGAMGPEGIVSNWGAFGLADRSFDLLNVKYLLLARTDGLEDWFGEVRGGIRFSNERTDLSLKPGDRVEFALGGVGATELVLITTMGHSTHILDGAPILRIEFHTRDGLVFTRDLQAGRDTAEWAYDRPEVRAAIRHRRPIVAESWDAGGFEGHQYLARVPVDRALIDRIVLTYARDDASILLTRASLHDALAGSTFSIRLNQPPAERWRKLGSFGPVELYENQRALPRAWFVRRVAVVPSADALQIIRSGKMKEGAPFDPAETVLFEREDFGNREVALPRIGEPANAVVKVTRYEPNRIELQTRNDQAGFLVLSEVWYRGWEAWIDGRRAPVERVNYLLRGLAVPAGEHRVEFVFRAHSFRNGAAWSLAGALLLLVGAGIVRFGRERF
ncbi:MAG: YfhO family protein [Blastocatellia bacterium]